MSPCCNAISCCSPSTKPTSPLALAMDTNITSTSNSASSSVVEDAIAYEPYNYSSKFVSIYTAVLLACLLTHRIGKCPDYLKRVSLVILLDITLLMVFPLMLFGYILVLLIRRALAYYFLHYCDNKIKLLDTGDVAWAGESIAQCNNFTSLYILQGECNVADIQRRIQSQLIDQIVDGQRIYERLEHRVMRKFGFYCWEKCEDFDIKKNVRLISNTTKEFNEDQVFDAIKQVADVPMSSDKPQWEILIVPKFVYNDGAMKDNYYAIIFRVHHSIMDGVSAGHALKYALADSPVKFSVDPMKAPSIPTFLRLLLYVKAILLGPMLLLTAMNVREANGFHRRVITGPKTFGWSKPVCMEALKTIKTKTKTTTTAVLMSAIGGALRNLAIKKGIPVPRRIHAAPTVAMLPYPDTAPRNRFIVVHYLMDTGLSSRLERIQGAHREALRLSTSVEPIVIFEMMKLGGRLPAVLADALMGTLRATMILSNVPGPVEPAYLFGGHMLTDSVFWVPLRNWTGIGACLFSYAGRVRAAFVGDHASLPHSTDVTDLITEFEKEVIAMGEMVGIKEENQVFWRP